MNSHSKSAAALLAAGKLRDHAATGLTELHAALSRTRWGQKVLRGKGRTAGDQDDLEFGHSVVAGGKGKEFEAGASVKEGELGGHLRTHFLQTVSCASSIWRVLEALWGAA